MNTRSDCVLTTQTNALGGAITPPMSTHLMPRTVAGNAGKPVRQREPMEGTNRGRESAERGYDTNPSAPDLRAAGGRTAWLLTAVRQGCLSEERMENATPSAVLTDG